MQDAQLQIEKSSGEPGDGARPRAGEGREPRVDARDHQFGADRRAEWERTFHRQIGKIEHTEGQEGPKRDQRKHQARLDGADESKETQIMTPKFVIASEAKQSNSSF